jgi:hypothetical protein
LTDSSQATEIQQGLVVSIDPGEHIGLAEWLPSGVFVGKRIIDFDTLCDYLEGSEIVQLVVEGFVSDGHTKQGGSRQPASQTIGAIRAIARRRGIPIKTQSNGALKPAAMHSGISIPVKGHIPDDDAAQLHGFYWFESQGMRARDIQL